MVPSNMKPIIIHNYNHHGIKLAITILALEYFDKEVAQISKIWHIRNDVQFLKCEHVPVCIIIIHNYTVTINIISVSF